MARRASRRRRPLWRPKRSRFSPFPSRQDSSPFKDPRGAPPPPPPATEEKKARGRRGRGFDARPKQAASTTHPLRTGAIGAISRFSSQPGLDSMQECRPGPAGSVCHCPPLEPVAWSRPASHWPDISPRPPSQPCPAPARSDIPKKRSARGRARDRLGRSCPGELASSAGGSAECEQHCVAEVGRAGGQWP